jgi:hypothetical protein
MILESGQQPAPATSIGEPEEDVVSDPHGDRGLGGPVTRREAVTLGLGLAGGTLAMASTASQRPGLAPSESASARIRVLLDSNQPLPMSGGLTGREIAVVVAGHTHAPSLAEIPRLGAAPAVVINSGCWLRQLIPIQAHGGVPPVFLSTFVLTHVRVSLTDAAIRVELWEHPKPYRRRLNLAERMAIVGRLPALPTAQDGPRIVAPISVTEAAPPQPFVPPR